VEATTPKACGVFWCAVLLVLLGSIRIHGQPVAVSNHVLELDGNGIFIVEFPAT